MRLADDYQQSAPGGIGAGNLFRIQAVLAMVVAVWVLWRGSRASLVAALVVGLSAVVAVVIYHYVDIPGWGPLPAMYEPIWYLEKALSAGFEALAALAALGALVAVPGALPNHDDPRFPGPLTSWGPPARCRAYDGCRRETGNARVGPGPQRDDRDVAARLRCASDLFLASVRSIRSRGEETHEPSVHAGRTNARRSALGGGAVLARRSGGHPSVRSCHLRAPTSQTQDVSR